MMTTSTSGLSSSATAIVGLWVMAVNRACAGRWRMISRLEVPPSKTTVMPSRIIAAPALPSADLASRERLRRSAIGTTVGDTGIAPP
jgi:hypothetical protein